MARLAYAVLVGLVGAAVVHIGILLMLPDFAREGSWPRLDGATGLFTTVPVDRSSSPRLFRYPDPFFQAALCRFDLAGGVVHIRANGHVPFWSVSVYNPRGENVYSFNDRTSPDGTLDFVVATPAQMIRLRKELPAELESAVFVEADLSEGLLAVRGFIPDETWRPSVSAFLNGMTCAPQSLDASLPPSPL